MRYLNISKLLKHIFIYSAFIRNIALIIFVVSFIGFSPTKVAAEIIDISNIVVEGNKRIETNTILNLAELESGKPYEYEKINSALQRIKAGTYGYCEETGEPIGLKRLMARPVATLSIEAQEKHERDEKIFVDD